MALNRQGTKRKRDDDEVTNNKKQRIDNDFTNKEDVQFLISIVSSHSFDDKRIKALDTAINRVGEIDNVHEIIKIFSFDKGKNEALELMVSKLSKNNTLSAIVGQFSFDEGKIRAAKQFLEWKGSRVTTNDLLDTLKHCSFDSGRNKILACFMKFNRIDNLNDHIPQLLEHYSQGRKKKEALEILGKEDYSEYINDEEEDVNICMYERGVCRGSNREVTIHCKETGETFRVVACMITINGYQVVVNNYSTYIEVIMTKGPMKIGPMRQSHPVNMKLNGITFTS